MFRSFGMGLIVGLFAFNVSALAPSSKKLCRGYFPPNNLRVPIGINAFSGGTTEARFNEILDRIQEVYEPVFAEKGARLEITRDWASAEVNAMAEQNGRVWTILMFGGMARHPKNNEEGFATVACHEIGHHIGGAPRYPRDWASSEGQSDYFATAKCMRHVYENSDNEAWFKTAKVHPLAFQRCSSQFKDRNEQLICMRSSVGTQALAELMLELDGRGKLAKLDTPDSKVVSRTSHEWPASQCRMDTTFNGALCTVDKSIEIDERDARAGACNQGADTYGWRPNCWFRP